MVRIEKWHKILGTVLGTAIFTVIMLSVYDTVVLTAATWGAGYFAGGQYDNAYIFLTMALLGVDYLLLIMGGGIFFALLMSSMSAESCGLDKGGKPTTGKVASDFFMGLLYPIVGVIVLLPLYGVIGFIAGFGRAQSAVASLGSATFSDVISIHFYTLGAFLMMSYAVYLIAMMPANAISTAIVSLVSLPHLKKGYSALEQRADAHVETLPDEQLSQADSGDT